MDRVEAIEIIKDTTIWCWHDRRAELREALDLAIEALQQERPKGEWEHHMDRNGILWERCSECGDSTLVCDRENINFCPNCGADMRGEKHENLIRRDDAVEAIESRQTEQWIESDIDYNSGLETALCEIKALPFVVCDDCIWAVCNYNKVDWDAPSAEAVEVVRCKD